jgi:hypothetical protein
LPGYAEAPQCQAKIFYFFSVPVHCRNAAGKRLIHKALAKEQWIFRSGNGPLAAP